jgi:ribosomal protein L9
LGGSEVLPKRNKEAKQEKIAAKAALKALPPADRKRKLEQASTESKKSKGATDSIFSAVATSALTDDVESFGVYDT